jgi:hypothetical protein
MATVYFGSGYSFGQTINGNWTDVTQFYAKEAYWDYETFVPAQPLNRLPTEQDTVVFKQALLVNFPTSWSGPTITLRLGRLAGYGNGIPPRVNATGTWSGINTGEAYVVGTSTQPVLSGQTQGGYFYGGNITGNLLLSGYARANLLVDSVFTGTITANSTGFLDIYQGSTVNTNINSNQLVLQLYENAVMSGSIINAADISVLPGAKILNSPTITCKTLTVRPKVGDTTWPLPNTTQILAYGSVSLNYTGYQLPRESTRLSVPSIVSVTCGGTLSIDNCDMLGSFTFAGSLFPKKLIVKGNSIVAQAISSEVINCYDYEIRGGTFTHPGDWTFGSLSTPATLNIGAELYLRYDVNYNRIDELETLTTSKNITIYSHNSNSSTVYLRFGNVSNSASIGYNSRDLGTYTGTITLLKTTVGIEPYLSIYGGTYSPTVTVPSTKNGSNYRINFTDFGNQNGFGVYLNSRYTPNILISNLPSDIDVLATQGVG